MMPRAFALCLVLLLTSCGTSRPPATIEKAPDENGAITAIKAINRAQQDFIRRTRRYALTYDELLTARLLNDKPTAETLGYEILLRPTPDAEAYSVIATPLGPPGRARHFFTDKTAVIRAEQGHAATADSPEL